MKDLVFWSNEAKVTFDVVDAQGERWVLASQVGEALGIQNIRDTFAKISQTEGLVEGTHWCRIILQQVGKVVQDRERLLLSYRGVIRVAMRSDGPRAVQFRDWAEDVLYEAMVQPSGFGRVPPAAAPCSVDRLYRQAASIVKATMAVGKSLGVLPSELRQAAVSAAYAGTGIRFCELLGAVPADDEAVSGLRSEAASVSDFLGSCCVVQTGACVSPGYLYDGYVAWCEENGHVSRSRNGFYGDVLRLYPSVKRGQVGPDRSRVFTGISLIYSGRVSE
jgi:hypothetical protein